MLYSFPDSADMRIIIKAQYVNVCICVYESKTPVTTLFVVKSLQSSVLTNRINEWETSV